MCNVNNSIKSAWWDRDKQYRRERIEERHRERKGDRYKGGGLAYLKPFRASSQLPECTYLGDLVIKCLSIDLQIEGAYTVGGTSYSSQGSQSFGNQHFRGTALIYSAGDIYSINGQLIAGTTYMTVGKRVSNPMEAKDSAISQVAAT